MLTEESIEDAEWSGRLGTMQTNENITRVASVLKDNRRASCRMIAKSMEYPKTIVYRILSGDLKIQKLCARFVPHALALTAERGEQRLVHAKDLIPILS